MLSLLPIFSLIIPTLAVPQVKLGNTVITGASFLESGVEFFGGIPFAQPPVGELRLKPPVLATVLDTPTFNATKFGPSCLNTAFPKALVSEDCLQLNVFRPTNVTSNAKIPILFWIYGGKPTRAFSAGATLKYNATSLVAQSMTRGTPIIVVSANYRLGPLGFPPTVEAAKKGSLNLGIKDQIAALKWVQNNIEIFGGDKSKVTIFGESAGGNSVTLHFLGKHIKGLARAAIAQSAPIVPSFLPGRYQDRWTSFISAIPECASLANSTNTFDCLRGNVTTASLLQGFAASTTDVRTDLTYFPTIDGPQGILPDLPTKLIPTARLPVILGSNLDEGTFFIDQHVNSTEQISKQLTDLCKPALLGEKLLNNAMKQILRLYPDIPALGSPFNTGNQTFGLSSQYKRGAAILGDWIFQAPRRAMSTSLREQGIPVYGYQFTEPTAISPIAPDPRTVAPGSIAVTHGAEIPFVITGVTNGTAAAEALQIMMQDYWISFAVTLNPNDGKGSNRPKWEEYSVSKPTVLQLQGGDVKAVPDTYRDAQMRFINSIPHVFHR
uniref:Carboxylic ester hydrolase n=1 Tax=Psilocybe cubensis TaxID=181762 RepID=A0A8H7XNH5_PSICU